jgi:hypothetical protein
VTVPPSWSGVSSEEATGYSSLINPTASTMSATAMSAAPMRVSIVPAVGLSGAPATTVRPTNDERDHAAVARSTRMRAASRSASRERSICPETWLE